MANFLTSIWDTVKEVDLRPLRQEALHVLRLAVVGAPQSGHLTLAAQLRRDPLHPDQELATPMQVLDPQAAMANPELTLNTDLIILVLGSNEQVYTSQEVLARRWANAGKKVLVFFNQAAPQPTSAALEAQAAQTAISVPKFSWGRHVIYGSVDDANFLLHQFAPLLIDMLPDRLLSLGRHFPLFRSAIANHLINETCFSNATYSFSTGLAEIVPVFTLPLNLTDTIVLTKSQAFLVYKLGLALGFSTRWQDYVAEFGSVLGAGFVWRQVARSLIGLIPAWGLIPKVGVAYSGTYVVGHVVYQWYLNGRHISRAQMNALYSRAAESGRQLARRLTRRLPRPRLKMPARRKAPKLPPPQSMRSCPNCKRPNNPDASFCQYCGNHF